ncbi:hypothetical protein GCM10010492_13630 [Saccharothrix mutabilis subsp. mutabilis]|uniref:Uncharacterized protein n=1 Tax=Saccharothrix mutabilis subsp. mutabilis TaxID=66855 RepID=A0ABP3CWB0_9PSEU
MDRCDTGQSTLTTCAAKLRVTLSLTSPGCAKGPVEVVSQATNASGRTFAAEESWGSSQRGAQNRPGRWNGAATCHADRD